MSPLFYLKFVNVLKYRKMKNISILKDWLSKEDLIYVIEGTEAYEALSLDEQKRIELYCDEIRDHVREELNDLGDDQSYIYIKFDGLIKGLVKREKKIKLMEDMVKTRDKYAEIKDACKEAIEKIYEAAEIMRGVAKIAEEDEGYIDAYIVTHLEEIAEGESFSHSINEYLEGYLGELREEEEKIEYELNEEE